MDTVELLKHVLLQTGAGWLLWALGALSVICLALAVERWIYFRSRDPDLRPLAAELDALLAAGDFDAASARLEQSRASAAAIAAAGLKLAARGPAAVEKAMHSRAALERGWLERGLTVLGTVGNNAPFLGLFGTVVGIIHAFDELGAGGNEAAKTASLAVMNALSEALVATAVGIFVAIPAVAAFNYFQRRTVSILTHTEVLTNLVLAYLQQRPSASEATVCPTNGKGAGKVDAALDGQKHQPLSAAKA